MTTRIFLDTNVQVYAAGRPHPLKTPCLEVLTIAVTHPEAFFTNAEVLQELIHRYRALRAWDSGGRESFASFARLMRGRVEPILASDVEAAGRLVDDYPAIETRDLLHAAVMNRLGTRYVVSADKDFDLIDGIGRLNPADVTAWQSQLDELLEA